MNYFAGPRWTGAYTREGRLYVSSRNGEDGSRRGWIMNEQRIEDRDAMFLVDSHFRWQMLGFAADRQQPPGFDDDVMQWDVRIPFWMLVLLLGIMPALFVCRRFRRRLRSGFCIQCGYDLRASRERCPECGHPRRV
jgi:hypothetical protein